MDVFVLDTPRSHDDCNTIRVVVLDEDESVEQEVMRRLSLSFREQLERVDRTTCAIVLHIKEHINFVVLAEKIKIFIARIVANHQRSLASAA
jgi:hypothetical protein